ncbi:uncharacterized protein [Nicotiana sylvestris]|uniref:uncharacterized protein n=1 Tax=Nicotiana sylvestris TaxID=4096 RepID=UPI00388C3BF2
MATTLHEIYQISSNSMQWNLKVRVVLMWEMPNRFNPEKTFSIELILQDAKGDRIQASIGKYVIKFFRTKIQELSLYRMNYFVVRPNSLNLKNTTHNLRLTFTQRTTVEEIIDSSLPMNIFNFRPFDQLTNQNDVDEAKLIDVIGQVVMYEDVKTHKQGDNNSVFLNVTLEDDQLVATCQANCERITQTSSQQSYSVRDELAKGIECTYWIAVKVVNLELQRGWSYLTCNKCTKKASIVDDDRSYPSELDDILYKRFMFKVIVKPSNIEKKDQVYTVVKITDDCDLLNEYCHSLLQDTFRFRDSLGTKFRWSEAIWGNHPKINSDFMAESQITSTSQTPIKKGISESGSSVVEDGDDWKAKVSPLKTYDKRTRPPIRHPE